MSSLPGTSEKRAERPDTKTLVRLGGELGLPERGSRPPVAEPASARDEPTTAASEPPLDPGHVELWLEGVREPVRVRAERVDAGLTLRAALPFLELDSVVGIATPDPGLPEHARIRRVRVDNPAGGAVPELSVELTFTDAAACDEPATDPAAGDGAALPAARAAERRARPWLGPWLGLAIGAALGAAATLGASALRAGNPRTPAPVPKASATAPAAARPPPSVAPAPAREPLPGPAIEAERLVLPPFAADDPALEPIDASEATDDAVAQVTVSDTETHVLVPMRGDARALRTYELSTPGLAVTLPHAQALGPLGNHHMVRGLVRRVWLLPAGAEGVQVRVITRRPATRTAVSYDDDGLRITLGH